MLPNAQRLMSRVRSLSGGIKDEATRRAFDELANEIAKLGDSRSVVKHSGRVEIETNDRHGALSIGGIARFRGETRFDGDVAWGNRIFLLKENGGGDTVKADLAEWDSDADQYVPLRAENGVEKTIHDPEGLLASKVTGDVVTAFWDTTRGPTKRTLGTDRQGEYVALGAGPQGSQGSQGSQGDDGAQGPQGHQGNDGLQGPQGDQGNDGLQGPQGDQGNDGPQGPQGEQGDKLAIVPAIGSYVGLFCVESPEVRFEDIMVVRSGVHEIDRTFAAVCEPGSIQVVGVSSTVAQPVSAFVRGTSLVVDGGHNATITAKLSGIRRLRSGVRFPQKSYREMLYNNRFWNQAHADVDPVHAHP